LVSSVKKVFVKAPYRKEAFKTVALNIWFPSHLKVSWLFYAAYYLKIHFSINFLSVFLYFYFPYTLSLSSSSSFSSLFNLFFYIFVLNIKVRKEAYPKFHVW
jgi:hypothetical protein